METTTDLEQIMYLDFQEEVPCESDFCRIDLGKGGHAADWYVRFDPCGEVLAWCNERFMVYSKDQLLDTPTYCTQHGQIVHVISWNPVRIT